ncbi:hypothetical protein BBJ28_00001730 [Nothophytophthora sp. Chile5]|nr:hypothetical protein BBJ28_00001730 [Nothophytophthora sp. Chile5]
MTVKSLIARFENKTPNSTSTSVPTTADYPAQGTVATLASHYEALIAAAGRDTRAVGSATTPTEDHSVSSIDYDSPTNAVDSDDFGYPATPADDHLMSSIDQDYSLDAIDLDGVFQLQANDASDVEPETTHISAHKPAHELQPHTTASTTTTTNNSTHRVGRGNYANTPSRVFDYENSPAWTQQRAANQAAITARRTASEQQPRRIARPSRASPASTPTTTATGQANRSQHAHVESRLFDFETSPDRIKRVAANQARIQARRLVNEQQTRAATIPSRTAASSTPAPPPPAQVGALRSRSMAANGARRAGRDPYAHVQSRVFTFMKPSAPPQPVATN